MRLPSCRIIPLVLAAGLAPAALVLARQAKTDLPGRPAVTARVADLDRKAAAAISTLSHAEVLELAKSYEERDQTNRARDLKRRWLDDQRDRLLDAKDVAGRIALARQYESLLGDSPTAAALLQAALGIEPGSPDVINAFRGMGFREVAGEWIAPDTPRPAPGPAPGGGDALDDSLRGATPAEVVAKMGGKPDRIVRSASQGRILEQWIYQGTGATQYINFLIQPGTLTPRVVARFTLP